MPLLFTALYFRAHYLLLHQVDLKVMSKLEIDEHTRVRIVICSVVRVSLTLSRCLEMCVCYCI